MAKVKKKEIIEYKATLSETEVCWIIDGLSMLGPTEFEADALAEINKLRQEFADVRSKKRLRS